MQGRVRRRTRKQCHDWRGGEIAGGFGWGRLSGGAREIWVG